MKKKPCPSFWQITGCLLAQLFLPGIQSALGQTSVDLNYKPSYLIGGGNAGINAPIRTIACRSDGGLYVTGNFSTVAAGYRQYLAALKSDGTADKSFSPSPDALDSNYGLVAGMSSISSHWSDTVWVSGYFSEVGGAASDLVGGLNAKGLALSAFHPVPIVLSGYVIGPFSRILNDGRVVVWGGFYEMGIRHTTGLGILTATGMPDPSFSATLANPSLSYEDDRVYCLAVQPDGKLLVGGPFNSVNGTPSAGLARLEADGSLDSSLAGYPTYSYVDCIALLPDGDVLVAGVLGGSRFIQRLNDDGSVDSGFNGTLDGPVTSMIPRVGGSVLITGNFTQVSGQSRNDIAILEADGSVSGDYATESTNSYVQASTIDPQGGVLLGGPFTSVSGQARSYLARLNPVGSGSQTITVDPDGLVFEWQRSGILPEVEDARFDYSTDGGLTYTVLGYGSRFSGGWQLSLSSGGIPGGKTVVVRAQGHFLSGNRNASLSLSSAKITVNRPIPVFADLPDPVLALPGTVGVAFGCTVSSAATVTGYQWKKNGVNIDGATSSSYSLGHAVTAADAGKYSVVVTSTAGSATSAGVTLTVVKPPEAQIVGQGKTAKFTVSLLPSGTATYQWINGGGDISGATTSTLSIPNTQTINEDSFSVRITTSAGSVTTVPVPLDVVPFAVQVAPPAHQLVVAGSAVVFSPNLSIEAPISFVWSHNKRLLSVTPTADLVLPVVTLADAGQYALRATNLAGSLTTSPLAELGVVDQTNPTKVVAGETQTAILKAPVAGNGLSVAWKKNGMPFGAVPPRVTLSADNRTLTIKQVTTLDAGAYTVDVTGPPGPAPLLTSAPVNLVVTTTAPEIDVMALNLPDGMVGAPYDADGSPGAPFVSYQIPTDSDPLKTATSYQASNLPPGIKLNQTTGQLSGTPTKAGDWLVKIKAKNFNGTSVEQSDNLHVEAVPSGLVGSFVGLVSRTALGEQHGGRVDITTTPAGSYSGRVTLGTAVYSFTSGDLQAGVGYNQTNTIAATKRGSPSLTLSFDIDPANHTVTGSVTDGTNLAAFSGFHNKWSKSVLATDYLGIYNFAMTPPALPLGSFSHPLGYGYGSFKPSDVGTLTIAGKLADGVPFTAASILGPAGEVILYQGFTNVSSIAGVVTVTLNGVAPAFATSAVNGSFTWLRDDQSTVASVRSYKSGFGPITLTAAGFEYTPPVSGTNALGVSTTTPVVNLAFTEGADVTTNPNTTATLSAANKVTISSPNPGKVAVTVVGSTGLISGGNFKQTDAGVTRTTKSLGGIIVREGTNPGIGYGFFNLERIPASNTSPVVSGKLQMQ